ncbi:MAG TPA: UMP kinase [Candidatus Saccharimonadales bacterium]|nr:UMP kinase [Candidatus Saccharimonadales bacterium]
MYKRVLLKFSGEQLAGKHDFGVDSSVARYIASQCKQVVNAGCELVLVVGGGNLIRGAETTQESGIKRVTADQMGMLAGLMNAMALTDIFEGEGLKTRCMSNVFATQVAESYTFRLAEKHLQNGRVVIVAGGIGRPFFTHDSAAVSIGLELGCNVVLKATKVDGVYDKDPKKFKDAVRFEKLSYQRALESAAIKVMDKAALGLAMEQAMPVVVLDALTDGNIIKAVRGEMVGTYIS